MKVEIKKPDVASGAAILFVGAKFFGHLTDWSLWWVLAILVILE